MEPVCALREKRDLEALSDAFDGLRIQSLAWRAGSSPIGCNHMPDEHHDLAYVPLAVLPVTRRKRTPAMFGLITGITRAYLVSDRLVLAVRVHARIS